MKFRYIFSAALIALVVTGCAVEPPYMAPPTVLTSPQAIQGNSGLYMSPYTTDGVLAEWVDKSVNAKTGAAVGGAVGAYAGEKLMENVPFFGGMLGQTVGESIGRSTALEMAGGEEVIKNSSDISFNDLSEMSVWLYVNHSSHAHFQDALDATMAIYPDLKEIYYQAIINASSAVPAMNR